MIIRELELKNFRNIQAQRLTFSPGVNILYGDNAQGKTNIIEAVRMLSTLKSFRSATEKELIFNGAENPAFAGITAIFEKNGRDQTAEIRISDEKRRESFLNGAKVSSKEFLGNFNSVLFYPEQLGLIKNGPDGRRRYLDLSICQIRPVFLSVLSQFARVLSQRNALLKSGDTKTIFIWDERFAKLSCIISRMRADYIKKLSEKAERTMIEISDGKEHLSLNYQPSFEDGEIEFLDFLEKNLEKDKLLGYTSVGAHKDDFETRINGSDVKIYGSQGQQRSCIMAFKLAETEILNDVYGEYPLVLLDDVYSELDAYRRDYITGRISGKQVIITSCENPGMGEGAKMFHVKQGKVFS